MATSPSTLNYFIGKGTITFAGRNLGNCPEVELTPEIEKLDHFSSMSGVRSKDRSIVLEKRMTLRIVVEEITAENLALLLLGTAASDGSFTIFEESEITGQVVFTGTNDVGNQITMTLPNVSFGPSGGLNLISDEWGNFELTGDVLLSDDSSPIFGTIQVTDAVA